MRFPCIGFRGKNGFLVVAAKASKAIPLDAAAGTFQRSFVRVQANRAKPAILPAGG